MAVSVTKIGRRAFSLSVFRRKKKKKITCMAEAPDTAAFQGLPFVSTPLPSVRCSLLCGDLQQYMQRFACVEKCMCVASQSWLAKQAVFLLAVWCQTEHLHFTAGNSDTQKKRSQITSQSVQTLCFTLQTEHSHPACLSGSCKMPCYPSRLQS